ncbi:uncharacterized protein RSE6_00004 [Rhynchosporium secalis]|uniref:Uncharacterized protein n=1 Tax=Rhynchosporium secalis TaxID=38038 RepID=A0A1E1LU43_RHYSE|nr:uncharacterized protein RSE6_00004 [Rhynchosporium secalis]
MRTLSLFLAFLLPNAATTFAGRVPSEGAISDGLDITKRVMIYNHRPIECTKTSQCSDLNTNGFTKGWNQPTCVSKYCRPKCSIDTDCLNFGAQLHRKLCPPRYPPTQDEIDATGPRCAGCNQDNPVPGFCVTGMTLAEGDRPRVVKKPPPGHHD